MRRYLFVITTRHGWGVYADRLEQLATSDALRSVDFIRYEPWRWARRVTRQTRYGDVVPAHIPVFDPFDVAVWEAFFHCKNRRSYDAIICATQSIAAAYAVLAPEIPVFAIIDATRTLYRELGVHGVREVDIQREKRDFKRFSHIFPYSKWVARDLATFVDPSAITVLPPFAQEFRSRARRSGYSRKQALFVGADFERKGGEILIAAQRQELWKHYDLTVVTPKRYHRANVPNTIWVEPKKNSEIIETFLPNADVLFHPTTRDCSAIIVAEAAVAGVPAISTFTGGVSELIDHDRSGLVVATGDLQSFIDAAVSLSGDDARLAQMKKAAKLRGVKEFAGSCSYKKMMEIVDSYL